MKWAKKKHSKPRGYGDLSNCPKKPEMKIPLNFFY